MLDLYQGHVGVGGVVAAPRPPQHFKGEFTVAAL